MIMPLLIFALLLGGCASAPIPKTMADIPHYDTRAAEWFFSANIRYWRDRPGKDDWRPCAKTLALGLGDCDDFAICARDIAITWPGCGARIVLTQEGRHAVTYVSCANGLRGYFDNGEWKADNLPVE